MSILNSLNQCCLIRYSTLQKLLKFQRGPSKLSEAFIASSSKDPAFPLVIDGLVNGLDRRLEIVLNSVRNCIAKTSFKTVVMDDGF